VRAATLLGGTVLALAALSAGCHRSGATDPRPAASINPEPAVTGTAPADHLAPGELLEGSEQAFGITLPRGVRVDGAFVQVVFASGPLTVHPLVQYFRSRLQGGDLREGETSATFEHVTVPGRSERQLSVRIAEVRRTAIIDIRDTTPRAAAKLPDEAARWKSVGLTPSGRIADPTHLE
jgi:hypothetical protein